MVSETSKHLKNEVKAVEIKMACFYAEHDISFNVAGHLKNVIQAICPDFKIENELTFGKTKAQAIITNVTGQAVENELNSVLQKRNFH